MFANEYYFDIASGETKEIELVLREADLEDMLENISMPEFTLNPTETPSPIPTEVPVEKTEKPIFSTPQIVAEPVAQGTNGGADPIHIILLVGALLMLAGGIAIVILLQKRK